MSKGSKQRPTDHAAFSANFDRIFNKATNMPNMPIDQPPQYVPLPPVNGPGIDNEEPLGTCQSCGATTIGRQCVNKACTAQYR